MSRDTKGDVMITRLKQFTLRNWPLIILVLALAMFAGAATITTLPQLPTSSGGVFTQDNLNQINTNTTTTNTNFANINAAIGSATGTSGTGTILCLTVSCSMTTPILGTPTSGTLTNATGLPLTTGVTGILPVANGGTGASTFSGVATQSIVIPLTLSQLQTLNSVGVSVLPTPAATSMYMMGPCTLNLTHGSAAFTGGGTVTIGYGSTAATTASNSTIASTVFTTFTASHLVVVQPTAQAVGATTLYAGLGVWMNAASADFASGTGGSGQLSCQYSVITGVS